MSEVSAIIAEHCLFDLDAPIMRLAAPDVPSMPFSPVLENEIMMNPEKILNKMRELAEFYRRKIMEITMPKLGESVHEGTIEQWLVSVGDHIDEYEPLCEVITDKVTAEVPSTISGTITEILVEAGQTVAIDTIICKIETADEKTNETTEEIQAKVDEHTQKYCKKVSATVEQTSTAKQNQPRNNGRFSPVVFKLASEHDIDLSQVVGSGFEGRVTKKDIMSVIENGGTTAQSDKQVQTKSTSDQAFK